MDLAQRLQAAYRGKRVWVTGHTGFKGSWLLAFLHRLGAEVYGFALPPDDTQPLFDSIGGTELCQHRTGDIRDAAAVQAALQEAQPDYVFHLAAQSLVRRSYQQPVETFSINALGTAQVLEAIRLWGGACAVVCVTTDKVYENLEDGRPLQEADPLGGWDPYSASKAATELVALSYRRSYFPHRGPIALATARAGNVIGGGDGSRDRLLPDVIRSLEAGLPVPVRHPNAVRPWQHVLECLTGYLLLGAALREHPLHASTAWNFGPAAADCLPVQAVVQHAIDAWGSGQMQVATDTSAPHEAGLLRLDATRAQHDLDWHPRLHAQEAIRWTIGWHRSAEPALAKTLHQIDTYLKHQPHGD